MKAKDSTREYFWRVKVYILIHIFLQKISICKQKKNVFIAFWVKPSKKIKCLENTDRKSGTCYMPRLEMYIMIHQAQFSLKLSPLYAIQWKKKINLLSNECMVHYSYCVLLKKKNNNMTALFTPCGQPNCFKWNANKTNTNIESFFPHVARGACDGCSV